MADGDDVNEIVDTLIAKSEVQNYGSYKVDLVKEEEKQKIVIRYPSSSNNLVLQPFLDLSQDGGGVHEWNFTLTGNTNIVFGPLPASETSNQDYLKKTDTGLRSEKIVVEAEETKKLPFFKVESRFAQERPIPVAVILDCSEKILSYQYDGTTTTFSLKKKKWQKPF